MDTEEILNEHALRCARADAAGWEAVDGGYALALGDGTEIRYRPTERTYFGMATIRYGDRSIELVPVVPSTFMGALSQEDVDSVTVEARFDGDVWDVGALSFHLPAHEDIEGIWPDEPSVTDAIWMVFLTDNLNRIISEALA